MISSSSSFQKNVSPLVKKECILLMAVQRPRSTLSGTSSPLPVFLPAGDDKSGSKNPPKPVAAVVLNRSTGNLELRSLTLYPSETTVSCAPAPDLSIPVTPSKVRNVSWRAGPTSTSGQPSDQLRPAAPGSPPRAPSSPALTAVRPSNLNVVCRQPYGPSGRFIRTSPVEKQSFSRLSLQPSNLPPQPPNINENLVIRPLPSRRGVQQPFSWSAACLVGGCCLLFVICTVGGCWYIFQTTQEGKQFLRNARKMLETRNRSTATTIKWGDVKIGVELLANITDSESPRRSTASPTKSSTKRPIQPCRQVLCEYQTSRWTLNAAAHPCHDFYSYVCGNWSQLDSNQSAAFETDQTKEIEIILEALMQRGLMSDSRNNIPYTLYDSCLEQVSYTDSKLFLGSLLQRTKLGKWPYRDNVLSKNQMWEIHARIFRMLGVSSLVSVSLERDPKNVSQSRISLGPPSLFVSSNDQGGLPAWFLPSLYRATSIFDPDFYEDVSQRVLQFSVKLQGLYEHYKEKPRKATLNSHTFYAALLRYTFDGIRQVRADTPILLKNQLYLKALKSLISSTKSSSVYNYLGFSVLAHMSPLLSDEFSTMGRARMAWLTGRWQLKWKSWQKCLWFIDDMNPWFLQSVYSEYAWPHLRPINVDALFHKVKDIVVKSLPRLQWCSGSRYSRCVDAVKNTTLRVGNLTSRQPRSLFFNVTTGYFLEEYIIFKRQTVQFFLNNSQRDLAPMLSVFRRSPTLEQENKTVYLPTAPFFEVFHNNERDLLLRSVHFLHSIYYAILETLRVDVFSSPQQAVGLSPKCARYRLTESKTGLFIQQLMQDVAAWELTAAYYASSDWNKHSPVENLGQERNFFVLAAMGKCANPVANSLSPHLAVSARTPSVINERLSNMQRFGEVWTCSKGSYMNPQEKCTLWQY